jgi:hypothetical protein
VSHTASGFVRPKKVSQRINSPNTSQEIHMSLITRNKPTTQPELIKRLQQSKIGKMQVIEESDGIYQRLKPMKQQLLGSVPDKEVIWIAMQVKQ